MCIEKKVKNKWRIDMWDTILLGSLVVLSFVNILAINHIIVNLRFRIQCDDQTNEKIREILQEVIEIRLDVNSIRKNTDE